MWIKASYAKFNLFVPSGVNISSTQRKAYVFDKENQIWNEGHIQWIHEKCRVPEETYAKKLVTSGDYTGEVIVSPSKIFAVGIEIDKYNVPIPGFAKV